MSFSALRALEASGMEDWGHAKNEKALSDAVGEVWGVRGRLNTSFFLPTSLTRDLTVGTASAGGYLVSSAEQLGAGVPNAGNSFLPRCTVIPAGGGGAQQLGRFDALPAAVVLANEASTITEASPTTSRSLLSPSNAGVYIEESRQWALQSEMGARAAVRLLMNALRNHMQVQIIGGAGSGGEVLGLANDSNVSNTSGATLTYAAICTAMETVEKAGGDAPLAWVLTSAAAKVMRGRPMIASGSADPILTDENTIGGYPAIVIGGTTAATAVFWRWQDLLVYEWMPLEIAVNPFAAFPSAIIGIRGWVSFNAGPLVNGSFATITSIT